ncbi:MAG: NAD(P)H-binding protein [Pseudomonadota bacterium]
MDSERVLVLGAKGRFARAAISGFEAEGWSVRAAARSWTSPPAGAEQVSLDAFDAPSVARAAEGCSVIVNALNPPYPKWADALPRFTANTLAAARSSGATVMLPGNVYSYGSGMPEVLDETTPHAPTTRKGRLREAMEASYREAAGDGVRTVILRAGDFIEGADTGNWFETHMGAKLDKGRFVYPGPLDRDHAWAYLPDLGRAMAALATRRSQFESFETIGFPGWTLTGDELVAQINTLLDRSLNVSGMPWTMIRLLGLVWAQGREVAEMAYLWSNPHQIDGAKFAALLPEFEATPVTEGLAAVLRRMGLL